MWSNFPCMLYLLLLLDASARGMPEGQNSVAHSTAVVATAMMENGGAADNVCLLQNQVRLRSPGDAQGLAFPKAPSMLMQVNYTLQTNVADRRPTTDPPKRSDPTGVRMPNAGSRRGGHVGAISGQVGATLLKIAARSGASTGALLVAAFMLVGCSCLCLIGYVLSSPDKHGIDDIPPLPAGSAAGSHLGQGVSFLGNAAGSQRGPLPEGLSSAPSKYSSRSLRSGGRLPSSKTQPRTQPKQPSSTSSSLHAQQHTQASEGTGYRGYMTQSSSLPHPTPGPELAGTQTPESAECLEPTPRPLHLGSGDLLPRTAGWISRLEYPEDSRDAGDKDRARE